MHFAYISWIDGLGSVDSKLSAGDWAIMISCASEAAWSLMVSIVSSYRIDTKKEGRVVVYANDNRNPKLSH